MAVTRDPVAVAESIIRVLREWEAATATAILRGCTVADATDLLRTLRFILAAWDSGHTVDLRTQSRCGNCGRPVDTCDCPDGTTPGTEH